MRMTVVKRRDAFDRDREGFCAAWRAQDDRLRRVLQRARARLADVVVPDALLEQAARLSDQVGTDGLRGELTLLRAMRALAALDGVAEATIDHMRLVAPSALRHRVRRDPLDETGSTARIERALAEMSRAVS
jgi:magnesium chelatase subunit I